MHPIYAIPLPATEDTVLTATLAERMMSRSMFGEGLLARIIIGLKPVVIADVKFPLKSRDEPSPVLMALQYIFVTPGLSETVFELLENKICKVKKKTGGKGMPACQQTGTSGIFWCWQWFAMPVQPTVPP